MPTLLQFRWKLGWKLLLNPDIDNEVMASHEISLEAIHSLCTAPHNAHNSHNHIWTCDASQCYQQYTCSWPNCNNYIRTFCSCTSGSWLCGPCHVSHVLADGWVAQQSSHQSQFFTFKYSSCCNEFWTACVCQIPQHLGVVGNLLMSSTSLVNLIWPTRYLWLWNLNLKLRLNSVFSATHEPTIGVSIRFF